MKLCLAFFFQNEADFLALHLPVILRSKAIDGVVCVDGGSDDASASIIRNVEDITTFGTSRQRIPLDIFNRRFDWRFDFQGNFLIQCAEECGYDAMLRLDPDELMFPDQIALIKEHLSDHPLLALPRINFAGDRNHWFPQFGQDYQLRAWRLHEGVHYDRPIHEIPVGTAAEGKPLLARAINGPIYHYAGLRPVSVRTYEKSVNYGRIKEGKPPITLPTDFPPPADFGVPLGEPFEGHQRSVRCRRSCAVRGGVMQSRFDHDQRIMQELDLRYSQTIEGNTVYLVTDEALLHEVRSMVEFATRAYVIILFGLGRWMCLFCRSLNSDTSECSHCGARQQTTYVGAVRTSQGWRTIYRMI